LLDIADLSCARGDRALFRGLSFQLGAGELLHIQGANGSGKTTLLRTLTGLSHAAHGRILWDGRPIGELAEAYRAELCYVGHANGMHGDLTAVENLRFQAGLSGAPDCDPAAILAELGLKRVIHLPAKLLSQGQKRRLALARLFVAPRRLWILDEPFTALDVRTSAFMAERVALHLAAGGMVILTSHQEVTVATPKIMTLQLDS
jgi:heme exporter protein A